MEKQVETIIHYGGDAKIVHRATTDESYIVLKRCPKCGRVNNGVFAHSGKCIHTGCGYKIELEGE